MSKDKKPSEEVVALWKRIFQLTFEGKSAEATKLIEDNEEILKDSNENID